mmetsp:Transcript_63860/g.157141  ORF Transcript_63860/g.157141 Transcript_63860/m.157141 type:complete len:149 (-) Transcript_63860:83-529(-)
MLHAIIPRRIPHKDLVVLGESDDARGEVLVLVVRHDLNRPIVEKRYHGVSCAQIDADHAWLGRERVEDGGEDGGEHHGEDPPRDEQLGVRHRVCVCLCGGSVGGGPVFLLLWDAPGGILAAGPRARPREEVFVLRDRHQTQTSLLQAR